MSASPPLLPGQTPPLAIVTPTDQRGVLFIVTALCLGSSLVSLIIRAYVRIEISRSYGHDDFSVAIASVGWLAIIINAR